MLYLSCWLCLAQCLIWESPENTHTHNTHSPSDTYPHHNSIYTPYQCNFFNSRESVVYTDLGNSSFLFFTAWSHVQQGPRQVLLTSLSFQTKILSGKGFPNLQTSAICKSPSWCFMALFACRHESTDCCWKEGRGYRGTI